MDVRRRFATGEKKIGASPRQTSGCVIVAGVNAELRFYYPIAQVPPFVPLTDTSIPSGQTGSSLILLKIRLLNASLLIVGLGMAHLHHPLPEC
jgi:hypothetical protein